MCFFTPVPTQCFYFICYLLYQTYDIYIKSIQYKNKSYSNNNEHHGSVALTDAQHEIKWVKNYNETLKTIFVMLSYV